MEKHACKVCSRRFPNGRALGGHMRSHVAAAGVAKRALHDSPASSSLSLCAGGGESSIVLPDGESDTESSKAPPLRRSKRRPRPLEHCSPFDADPGPASSVSDTTPDDDVARCLMMLSRDVWRTGGNHKEQKEHSPRREIPADSIRSQMKSRKIHQCSVCLRIFNSGQALGGHKRSHLIYNSTSAVAATRLTSKYGGEMLLDLNEPPEEEGELSAVSYTPR